MSLPESILRDLQKHSNVTHLLTEKEHIARKKRTNANTHTHNPYPQLKTGKQNIGKQYHKQSFYLSWRRSCLTNILQWTTQRKVHFDLWIAGARIGLQLWGPLGLTVGDDIINIDHCRRHINLVQAKLRGLRNKLDEDDTSVMKKKKKEKKHSHQLQWQSAKLPTHEHNGKPTWLVDNNVQQRVPMEKTDSEIFDFCATMSGNQWKHKTRMSRSLFLSLALKLYDWSVSSTLSGQRSNTPSIDFTTVSSRFEERLAEERLA